MYRKFTALLLMLVCVMLPITAFAVSGFSSNPDAIEQAAKSVLMLEVYDSNNEMIATGSGFVAFNNRTIVTNYHVIEDADWMMANSDDGYQYMVTKVLVANEEKDIAICEFMSPTDLQPLEFNVDRELKRAENVVAIGSPKGFTNIVSLGNISAIYRDESLLQFTAPISHGSSGGALFDDSGRVIGITSGGFDDAQNLNVAVHISEVETLYNSWDGLKFSFSEFMAIANATPTPAPTATPTPTPVPTATPKPIVTLKPTSLPKFYKPLKKGDAGENVKRLQEELIRLGYLDGTADGIFDNRTATAVSEFNYRNFSQTWFIATVDTLSLLFDGNPKPYASTNTSKPTSTSNSYATLQEGDSGEEVRLLQEKLITYGYLDGTATGIYDEATKAAVKLFNEFNLSNPSGRAFPEMQKHLFEGNPVKYNPAYTTIERGDRGETVKRLQQELIKLGYLDGTADGIFGAQTEEAVKAFNQQNFSNSSKKASPRTLRLLFDGQPKQFKDVEMVLHFKSGAYAEWDYLSGDKLKIHFQVTSKAKKKTVKAFELYVYATDVWGNKIYGSNNIYNWTTTKTVSPGKTVYSDYVTIPKRSSIDMVYCGIHKVAYTDGTTYTVPSVNYASWTIR